MKYLNTLPCPIEVDLNHISKAEEFIKFLDFRKEKTIFDVQKKLQEYNSYPNDAIHALIEDFVDTFARNKNIRKELMTLMSKHKFVFWPEKYNSIKELTELKQTLESRIINSTERYLEV